MKRLWLAIRSFFWILVRGEFPPQEVSQANDNPSVDTSADVPHASAVTVLALLQRHGRLVDFLLEDIGGYSDEQVGAAARGVHSGCRRVFDDHIRLRPVLEGEEGAALALPDGFDRQAIELTGNVALQPPYRGTLRHHGWEIESLHLPTGAAHVVATAEVEL